LARLHDLLRQVAQDNSQLADDLRTEIEALQQRRAFGLNFERHVPESVELPGRPVRRGDKVRFLPERGQPRSSVSQDLWQVKSIEGQGKNRRARLTRLVPRKNAETTATRRVDDLIVVAEFMDPIYPGLESTGTVKRGGNKPYHSVINAENFHALQALQYTHAGRIDAIYIDPPYNTGAKDWKYNNNYVDSEDAYRHSKWLAFMERRLKLAKKLLNPKNSVLICTIDEKEYLRLGLLLGQTFPEAKIQMITSITNPKGTARTTYYSRTDEYLFYVFIGQAKVINRSIGNKSKEVRWRYLRRTDVESARGTTKGGTAQFYPIYVNDKSQKIEKIGEPLSPDSPRSSIPSISGCTAVFPIREKDGMEMNWGLVGASLKKAMDKGFVRVSAKPKSKLQPYVFSYLTAPNIKKIAKGKLKKTGTRPDGSWIVVDPIGKSERPTTVWNEKSHEAGAYGTTLLRACLPSRKFPYPKSLYAVEDALRFFVADKPGAVILDFFSGSGTTAHAVMRLNRQDGGRRQCILVTNNEVSESEEKKLRTKGRRPGDPEWEALGICDYITKPRIQAAITGQTPEGEPIKGDYRFTDKFPMAEGFEENVEFFSLTYQDPLQVEHHLAFAAVAPLLWLKAGARGPRIEQPASDFALAETYAVLFDLDTVPQFLRQLEKHPGIATVFVITDDAAGFQSVDRQLPDSVQAFRLYESYLTNFRINQGRTL